VLVHGGGHGGWCWQRMARVLRDLGHDVWTPTLTGFGERHHLDDGRITFDTFVTDIGAVLEFEDLHDVVLVGHSMSGVVVPRVAEAFPGRIGKVVWMAAVVLNDGETITEASAAPSPAVQRSFVLQQDGTIRTDPALMIEALVSDGTPADRAWVLARHRSYPQAALTERGSLTTYLELGIPSGYVAARHDAVFPLERARAFADRLPGVQFAEVEAGHDLMITRPIETAEALVAVSEA
jgi:pimeloyl-ACP methyl ester carboxylesterase